MPTKHIQPAPESAVMVRPARRRLRHGDGAARRPELPTFVTLSVKVISCPLIDDAPALRFRERKVGS